MQFEGRSYKFQVANRTLIIVILITDFSISYSDFLLCILLLNLKTEGDEDEDLPVPRDAGRLGFPGAVVVSGHSELHSPHSHAISHIEIGSVSIQTRLSGKLLLCVCMCNCLYVIIYLYSMARKFYSHGAPSPDLSHLSYNF